MEPFFRDRLVKGREFEPEELDRIFRGLRFERGLDKLGYARFRH